MSNLMARFVVALFASSFAFAVLAADQQMRFVDLRDAQAVLDLKQSNPAHYEKIQKILEGLREQPERAEADWLQTNFDAQDVLLSRSLFKTSNPPKQTLQFRLDDVHYMMHLTRSDLSAERMLIR